MSGDIPADIIHQNDDWIAFRDINPQAPVHILIVPRKRIARLAQSEIWDEALLGKLLLGAKFVARQEGLEESGYRVVINNGPHAGETVPHLHVHLLGGRALQWPPG